MPNLIPTNRNLEPTTQTSGLLPVPDRRAARALVAVERQTLTRMATVRGHAMVQVEKVHEIDRLTREAMTGQAMLARWAATLAAGDPFIADEMKFFSDVAKLGKGEVIADTVSAYCQEGR